jgi:hypothetical protein
MKTLIYCLNILKIKEDSEIYRNAVELAQKLPIESANGGNEWISVMEIISNASITSYIFSQSQLADFDVICKRHRRQKNEFRNNNLQNL